MSAGAALFIVAAATAEVVSSADIEAPCKQRGPAYFECPIATGGCRARLDDAYLKTTESTLSVEVSFLKWFGVEVREKAVQPIAEAVHHMREALRAIVHDF